MEHHSNLVPWQLLFASDFWFHPDEINSGIIFLRGGPSVANETCGILRRWWDASFPNFNVRSKPWEQAAMQAMYVFRQGKARDPRNLRPPWGSRVRLLPSARFFHRVDAQWLRLGAAWIPADNSSDPNAIYTEDDYIHHGVRAVCCRAVTTLAAILNVKGSWTTRSGRRGGAWQSMGKLALPPTNAVDGAQLAARVFSFPNNASSCPRAHPDVGGEGDRTAFDRERTCCHHWRRRNHSHTRLDGSYTPVPRRCWKQVKWERPVFEGQVWTC